MFCKRDLTKATAFTVFRRHKMKQMQKKHIKMQQNLAFEASAAGNTFFEGLEFVLLRDGLVFKYMPSVTSKIKWPKVSCPTADSVFHALCDGDICRY